MPQGYVLGKSTQIMHELAPWMLKYAGWELEVAAHWPIEVGPPWRTLLSGAKKHGSLG